MTTTQQMAPPAVSVAGMRQAAISETIASIRTVEAGRGVNPAALEEIRALLLNLAERRELFPAGDFPCELDERGQNPIYVLSEDADKRFALYMSVSQGAKRVPPHNHTTWAVIAGVAGEERNVFYERADDGSQPGKATLRVTGEETVRPGSGVTLMPEDIHHIETPAEGHTLHLHMYGLALDRLPERDIYDLEAGTTRKFTAKQNLRPLP